MKSLKFLTAILIITLFSCDNNRVFEKNTDFKLFEWEHDSEVVFNFKIEDEKPKNVLVNFRHTSVFLSRNVLLSLKITNPKNETEKIDINIPLSEPNGMWFGDCSGNICDIQFPINYTFIDTGNYIFSFTQNMRENPLSNIMSIGLRIENPE